MANKNDKLNLNSFRTGPNNSDFCVNKKIFGLFRETQNIYKIHVLLKPNNIFLLFGTIDKTIIKFCSGRFNYKITKKSLRYGLTFLILELKKLLVNYINTNNDYITILHISSPFSYRTFILNSFKYLKNSKNKLIIKIENSRAFNGCRAKKEIRKKSYKSIMKN